MIDQLGARPERMRAAIGPCICRDCYQVGPEVIQAVYQNLPDLDPDTLLLPPHPFQTDRSAPSQGAIQLSQQDRETSLHGGKVNTPYQPQPPDKNPPKTSNQQDFPPDCTGKTPKNTQKCTKKGHFSPQKGHFTQAQFNLELANSRQLQAAGLCKYTTEFSGCCTFEKIIFPSHRRDGNQAGRWALLATLSQP
jgi:copper oxidase (laccase) domain-containing protein